MLLQEVYYALSTEEANGFLPNPRLWSDKTLVEAEKRLARWRCTSPNVNAFIVRIMITRISKKMKKSQARLKAV